MIQGARTGEMDNLVVWLTHWLVYAFLPGPRFPEEIGCSPPLWLLTFSKWSTSVMIGSGCETPL